MIFSNLASNTNIKYLVHKIDSQQQPIRSGLDGFDTY